MAADSQGGSPGLRCQVQMLAEGHGTGTRRQDKKRQIKICSVVRDKESYCRQETEDKSPEAQGTAEV